MTDLVYVFSPFDFGEIIRTKEEATFFINSIDKILDSFFNVKESPSQRMREMLPYHLYSYLERLAGKQGVLLDNKPMVKNFLTQVKTFVQNIPVVTIEIAFLPTDEILTSMSNYLSIYLKRTILFEVVLNKTLIAGAKLNYNGKYKDFSFKKQFDDLLRLKAEEIIKTL